MNPRDLLPGERFKMTARQHWVVLVRPFAVTLVVGIASLGIALLIPVTGEVKLFLVLAILVIALAVANLYYWRWHAQEYVLTDQRVILNEGLVSRFSRSIAIDRIQDLTTYQGLWGRAWGFGDIELESAGREGGEFLRRIPRPQRFRNAIFTEMEARRGQARP